MTARLRRHPSLEPHRHGPRLLCCLGWVGSDRFGGSGSVTRVQLRLLDFEFFVPCSGAIFHWGYRLGALGSDGCNDGRLAIALYGWWCLQGSPWELLLPWDCRHAGAYVMRRSCLVLARVPTEAMGWMVGTRGHPLSGPCPRFADPRSEGSLTLARPTRHGFFRNGGPGQVRCRARPGR